MMWVRLPSECVTDPEVLSIGFVAFGFYVRALAYSNLHGLDGVLSRRAIRIIMGSRKDLQRIELVLIRSQWLRRDEERNYVLLKFMDLQPSAAEVRELQRKRREAGQAGGQASAQARAQALAKKTGKQTVQPRSGPVPDLSHLSRGGGTEPHGREPAPWPATTTTDPGGLALDPDELLGSTRVRIDDSLLAAAAQLGLDATAASEALEEMKRKTAGWADRTRADWHRYLVGYFRTARKRRQEHASGEDLGVVRPRRTSRSPASDEDYYREAGPLTIPRLDEDSA